MIILSIYEKKKWQRFHFCKNADDMVVSSLKNTHFNSSPKHKYSEEQICAGAGFYCEKMQHYESTIIPT